MSNPISEANPASLDELFSRDPLGLADSDLDIIVMNLRKQREAWETGKPIAKPKAKKTIVSLEDLGLL